MSFLRSMRWIRWIPILALATCLWTTQAKADAYHGQFTLASPAQWGDVALPPGTYRFKLASTDFPYTLYLEGNGRGAYIVARAAGLDKAGRVQEMSPKLRLDDVGGRLVVRELDLPTLGLSLEYSVPKTNRLVSGVHTPEGNSACSGKQ
ncbi:MAG TPA: hypothetical protein VGS20_05105 [Candidatus Acidoferrales bacterium]|nr:hypothetical protein [Candidatus Acidoferrales bacterium]